MKKSKTKIRSSQSRRKVVRKFNPDHLGNPTIGEQLMNLIGQQVAMFIPIGIKNSSRVRGILAYSQNPENGAWRLRLGPSGNNEINFGIDDIDVLSENGFIWLKRYTRP